jgi:hypothetical protein
MIRFARKFPVLPRHVYQSALMSDLERAIEAVLYGQALTEDHSRDRTTWLQDNMLVISTDDRAWCIAAL